MAKILISWSDLLSWWVSCYQQQGFWSGILMRLFHNYCMVLIHTETSDTTDGDKKHIRSDYMALGVGFKDAVAEVASPWYCWYKKRLGRSKCILWANTYLCSWCYWQEFGSSVSLFEVWRLLGKDRVLLRKWGKSMSDSRLTALVRRTLNWEWQDKELRLRVKRGGSKGTVRIQHHKSCISPNRLYSSDQMCMFDGSGLFKNVIQNLPKLFEKNIWEKS